MRFIILRFELIQAHIIFINTMSYNCLNACESNMKNMGKLFT